MTDQDSGNSNHCVACGEFPISHLNSQVNSTVVAWHNDRLQSLYRSTIFSPAATNILKGRIRLTPYVIRAIHMGLGGATWSEPSHVISDRTRVIWEEAIRRGIPMEQVAAFGNATDFYRFRAGGRWHYFQTIPIPAGLEADAFPWSDDKHLFKQFLLKHHIPTAPAAMATNVSDAMKKLAQLHMPVVVKPRIGSNSRHTTKFIKTEEQFKIAFKTAQQLCHYVVFEEFLTGEVSRATVVGGKLVGFLQTKQPSVTGDGIRTLLQLIDENDAKRPEGVAVVTIAGENEAYIRRQGYELNSIPEKGSHIIIGRFGGRFSGGETHEMLGDVHPKLRAWVEKTAQLMKAPLVGFDLIIGDPSADPDSQVWGILEANTVPYIDIHTDPLYGTPSNVAGAIWDLWKISG